MPGCPCNARRAFEKRSALIQHCVRDHKRRTVRQSIVLPDECPICLRSYGTRRRAVDHISYRALKCRRAALAALADGSAVVLSEADERRLRDLDLEADAMDRAAGRARLAPPCSA